MIMVYIIQYIKALYLLNFLIYIHLFMMWVTFFNELQILKECQDQIIILYRFKNQLLLSKKFLELSEQTDDIIK